MYVQEKVTRWTEQSPVTTPNLAARDWMTRAAQEATSMIHSS